MNRGRVARRQAGEPRPARLGAPGSHVSCMRSLGTLQECAFADRHFTTADTIGIHPQLRLLDANRSLWEGNEGDPRSHLVDRHAAPYKLRHTVRRVAALM